MPILRLAGKAPRRRRPVNSALGGKRDMVDSSAAALHSPWLQRSEPCALSQFIGLAPTQPHLGAHAHRFAHVSGAQAVRHSPRWVQHRRASATEAIAGSAHVLRRSRVAIEASRSSTHCLRCVGATAVAGGSALSEAAVCNQHKQPGGPAQACPPRSSSRGAPVWHRVASVRVNTKLPPNPSLNRSANGMAPCPRGSACLSSASRARRHAAVARLTLR